MREIILDDDTITKVSDEDYSFITSFYKLNLTRDGYIYCKLKRKYKHTTMGFYTSLTLHRLLANPDKKGRKIVVDHIDGDKLNNTRNNLRVVEHYQNMRNRKSHRVYGGKKTHSEYKGASYNTANGCWYLNFRGGAFMGKEPIMELYTSEIAAANAYNYYAKQEYGEFAKLNDVPYMSYEETQKYRTNINKTSEYRGVSYFKNQQKWVAQIWDGRIKKNITIGKFDDEIDAAKAYNEMAIKLKGNKARLNELN